MRDSVKILLLAVVLTVCSQTLQVGESLPTQSALDKRQADDLELEPDSFASLTEPLETFENAVPFNGSPALPSVEKQTLEETEQANKSEAPTTPDNQAPADVSSPHLISSTPIVNTSSGQSVGTDVANSETLQSEALPPSGTALIEDNQKPNDQPASTDSPNLTTTTKSPLADSSTSQAVPAESTTESASPNKAPPQDEMPPSAIEAPAAIETPPPFTEVPPANEPKTATEEQPLTVTQPFSNAPPAIEVAPGGIEVLRPIETQPVAEQPPMVEPPMTAQSQPLVQPPHEIEPHLTGEQPLPVDPTVQSPPIVEPPPIVQPSLSVDPLPVVEPLPTTEPSSTVAPSLTSQPPPTNEAPPAVASPSVIGATLALATPLISEPSVQPDSQVSLNQSPESQITDSNVEPLTPTPSDDLAMAPEVKKQSTGTALPDETEPSSAVSPNPESSTHHPEPVSSLPRQTVESNTVTPVANATIESSNLDIPELVAAPLSDAEEDKVEHLNEIRPRGIWFALDHDTCSPDIPGAILNLTMKRILNDYLGPRCTDSIELKLAPVKNKMIRSRVMETSSAILRLSQLLVPKVPVQAVCHNYTKLDEQLIKFNLNVSIISQDAWFESKWRQYEQLDSMDEIPLELPGEEKSRGLKSSLRSSSKCQRFQVSGGSCRFGVVGFEGVLSYEITLRKLGERAYLLSQARVQDFRLKRLNLDRTLLIGGGSNLAAPNQASAGSVQILHDHNNHHKRNNWLLDLYANWLRHEYRWQLSRQLRSTLLERLNNSCKPAPSAGPPPSTTTTTTTTTEAPQK